MEGKYLITTDCWFYAPDGKKYRAAFGEVQVLGDDILGIRTNEKSSNWFAKIGDMEGEHLIVAGCQIHYAIKCESIDNREFVRDFLYSAEGINEFNRPNEIWQPKSFANDQL